MQTTIANERVLMFKDQINEKQAHDLAFAKKVDAFGTIEKFASFLSKPKDEDFKITYSEHRYQPIWHVKGQFKYVYDRKTVNKWPIHGKEVKNITIEGTDYTVANNQVIIESIEHCTEEDELEVLVDGISGEKQPVLKKYLSFIATILDQKALGKIDTSKTIMIPPKTRVSALVNEIFANSVKVIQADKVYEEKIDISNVDLYYLPVYAFQFEWISKKKEIVIEVDALTGEVRYGNKLFKEYLGKALDTNFLFDIGADFAGMILPGGSIAVKLAKKYIDSNKK